MKNFLLGVGAQKSGTTWLWNYLRANPAVKFGFCKEYHLFDALWVNEEGTRKSYLQDRINRLFAGQPKPSQQEMLLLRFLGNPDLYFKFFRKISAASDSIRLTGEITPSYSALPVEALDYIRSSLIREGFNPRVIFLMRDPVERCISAVRMNLKGIKGGARWTERDENERLAQSYSTPGFQMRTRYDLTIANLEQVFARNELFYAFYEEMFADSTMASICNFLDIPFLRPDFGRKINVSRTSNKIDDALIHQIRQLYEPVYEYIGERFGRSQMSALWKYFDLNG